jgi:hypothetical protein
MPYCIVVVRTPISAAPPKIVAKLLGFEQQPRFEYIDADKLRNFSDVRSAFDDSDSILAVRGAASLPDRLFRDVVAQAVMFNKALVVGHRVTDEIRNSDRRLRELVDFIDPDNWLPITTAEAYHADLRRRQRAAADQGRSKPAPAPFTERLVVVKTTSTTA